MEDKRAFNVNVAADLYADKLKEFDVYLFNNKYNPGTTADLTAASIFVSYLKDNFE